MDLGLRDRVCVVTGSTAGIGLEVARLLADEGARVVTCGRGEAPGVGETLHIAADLSVPGGPERVIEAALGLGGIDCLVNNVGAARQARFEEVPDEEWEAYWQLNLMSHVRAIRAALPAMRERGYGRIINIASAHGLVASPFKAAYVAAKHGIVGLTKVAALEAAEQGITCNAICPGYVYTPLVEAQIDGQAKAHGISRDQVIRDVLLAQQPNKRFATVEEIGALTVFLASEAAASITGTALPVDGGWTAH